MAEYTREQLLGKLAFLIDQSDFISENILWYWLKLDNEKLIKLIKIVYINVENEKKLSNNEKQIIADEITRINKEKINLYNNFEKQIRKDIEEIDDKNDQFDESLLNF